MTLEEKAKECIEKHTHKLVDKPTKQDIYTREESIFISGYKLGAKENGVIIHNLKENPDDLPKCDESKPITFYVEEWIDSIQKYHKHYCLGFYKKPFMNDGVKLFVEKSKGYENEHLPKTVLFWYENPTV